MDERPDLRTLTALLVHQALVALGEVPHPETNKAEQDLAQARFTIDLLDVLEQRTRSSRTEVEEQYMVSTLVQLRLAYVRATQNTTSTPPSPTEENLA